VASKETATKSRNLAAEGRCVITTDAGDMHLIVEGEARRVRDEATLRRASDAFGDIYGWPTVVAGDKLDAEYGAPTSGGPPYDVYEITPTKAFGLPTDGESFAPTRWRFDEYEEDR
ncbi:MAG: pyridoxamine 5'-phosphate oxidase family protein, partial [Actinomycetota bacterium]|nr:pyridoxamine 5'-phosphate oxidase family protein [Actinomycetota bacterium]